MQISDEAVEAALVASRAYKSQRSMDNAGKQMRAILEAAAPYMLREAETRLRSALDAVLSETQKWVDSKPVQGAEKSQEWYSLGKRHAAEAIQFEIRESLRSQA